MESEYLLPMTLTVHVLEVVPILAFEAHLVRRCVFPLCISASEAGTYLQMSLSQCCYAGGTV